MLLDRLDDVLLSLLRVERNMFSGIVILRRAHGDIEALDVAAGGRELVESTLFDDPAAITKCDDKVCRRKVVNFDGQRDSAT